jgi:hypothetical protein
VFDPEDNGRFLFHYTSAEVFLGHVLPTGRLRMSPFAEVNDPRESKDWVPTVALDDPGLAGGDPIGFARRFGAALKVRAKVLCFTRDDPSIGPEVRWPPFAGRGFAHPRMWDRYANGHRGVCLAYDIDTLGDDIAMSLADRGELRYMGIGYGDDAGRDLAAFRVSAARVEEIGMDAAVMAHLEEHHGALFFAKSGDWSSECEWRWVLLSNQDDRYEFVDVRRSLKGVLFGPDYAMDSLPWFAGSSMTTRSSWRR